MLQLSMKEWLLNIVLPTLIFLGGLVGSFVLGRIVPETDSNIIRKNKIEGNNQKAIKKLPSVQAFQEYLSYIVKKDTVQIWNHMSQTYQKSFGSPYKLLYSYYLTKEYQINYIIPISDDHFYAFMRFEDDVISEEVMNIKSYANNSLHNLAKDTIRKNLSDEVFKFINRRFLIDDPDSVKSNISDYISNMTLNDYVTQDWRFPIHIATALHLPPKKLERNKQNLSQGHEMVCEVEMEFDENVWKVKKFETIAISRWK